MAYTGSFSSIKIARQIPLVGGYVRVSENQGKNQYKKTTKDMVAWTKTLPDGARGRVVKLDLGKISYVEMPPVAVDAVDTRYNAVKALLK